MGRLLSKNERAESEAKSAKMAVSNRTEQDRESTVIAHSHYIHLFLSFIHTLSSLSRSLNILSVFFHYCIDARTTQYYLPLLATMICLIDLYLYVIHRVTMRP